MLQRLGLSGRKRSLMSQTMGTLLWICILFFEILGGHRQEEVGVVAKYIPLFAK